MTTLRVIIDDILLPDGGATARYAEELTRALIATAPRGSDVAGVVAASPEGDYARLATLLPGLRHLHKSALARRELVAAWQHGFTVLPGTGMVHAPSAFAPLRRHDRALAPESQTVVTLHDAIAWTHPETMAPRAASWARAMGKRAERHADAIVVPSHAVAADLAEHLDLGGRVRVIGAAPSSRPSEPADGASRRAALGLPERYVVTVIDGDPRNGFDDLAGIAAALEVPLVVVGSAADLAAVEAEAIVRVGAPSAEDRVAVLSGAAVYLEPMLAARPAGTLLDAFGFALPTVASDLPAIAELAADDAAILIPRDDGFTAGVAEAIRALLEDRSAAERAAVAAGDRGRAFTWRDAAEKVWQLHADL